jgi:hypothetical protein
MEGEELVRLGVEMEEAADALRAKAAEIPSSPHASNVSRSTPPPGMPTREPEWR